MFASIKTAVITHVSRIFHLRMAGGDDEVAAQVGNESLLRLFDADLRAIVTSVLVLVCYLYMQSAYLNSGVMLNCLLILLLPVIIRRWSVHAYRQHAHDLRQVRLHLRIYRLCILLSGFAWGGISLFSFIPGNLVSQSMNAITLAGVVGGASITYSVDKRAMSYFTLGALLLGLPRFFLQSPMLQGAPNQSAMIGVLIILFSVFVFMASNNVANILREYIKMRIVEKQDKDQIKTLLEKQKLHMDATPLGVIEWLPDGRVVSWNMAATKIFGFSETDMLGQSLHLLFPPSAQSDLQANTRQLLNERGGAYLKSGNLTKANKEIFCEWFNTPILDDAGHISSIASMVQDETLFVQAQHQVQRLAYYDALTNLPNRRMLMDRLRQVRGNCVRSKAYSALMFIDLDNFKEVNDAHGHDVGDQLLKNISKRLQKVIRSGDTVARMGGDEFVILLADLGKDHNKAVEACNSVANKMILALSIPFTYRQFSYPVTASLGISLIHAGMGSAEDILRHADQAMYEAKAAGRNCMRFYEESLEHVLDRKSMLKLELSSAIQKQQLSVFFQPQMAENTLIGAESLLRWEHPQFGKVNPEEFITLAEESGVIISLGHWMLEQVCKQLQFWCHEGGCFISLAVNVSALQFAQNDFVERVEHVLQCHDFPPHLLKLELTESLMIHDIDEIVRKMQALKTLGVCLSLDDFGTGYSSLSVLKKLPLDELKIDRIFVQDILKNSESAAIAETIVSMGLKLNMSIIAEGVETEDQVRFLESLGCHKFQGYLYGKPCSIAEFERLRTA